MNNKFKLFHLNKFNKTEISLLLNPRIQLRNNMNMILK